MADEPEFLRLQVDVVIGSRAGARINLDGTATIGEFTRGPNHAVAALLRLFLHPTEERTIFEGPSGWKLSRWSPPKKKRAKRG